jgi:hypothetical protein
MLFGSRFLEVTELQHTIKVVIIIFHPRHTMHKTLNPSNKHRLFARKYWRANAQSICTHES